MSAPDVVVVSSAWTPPIEPGRMDHGDNLGDRVRRLAVWADATPQHARVQIATEIDRLATLLGRLVAEHEDKQEA